MDKYYADPKYSQFTGPASGRDRVLARVNGEAIRREQLDERLVGLIDLRLDAGQPVDPQTMDKVRASLLDSLVSLTVERQEALRRNIEVTPEELEAAIARFTEQQGGEELLMEALRESGIDNDEFRRLCEQEVRVRKLREAILAEPVPDPSEEDIQRYYRENRDKWTLVRASSIFIEAPRDLPPLERQKKRELAERVRTMAMQGTDFAELAREYSEDPDSREAGGDLGWIAWTRVAEDVRANLRGLAIGAVTDIVEIDAPQGSEGFSIFKLTGLEQPTPDHERLQTVIIAEWKNLKRQEQYRNWLVQKRNDSEIVLLDTTIRDTLGV